MNIYITPVHDKPQIEKEPSYRQKIVPAAKICLESSSIPTLETGRETTTNRPWVFCFLGSFDKENRIQESKGS